MWQDIVITLVQFSLAFALLPTVLHPTQKPTLATSLFTGTLLLTLGVTFATLELYGATISSAVAGLTWYVLAWQRHRLNRQRA